MMNKLSLAVLSLVFVSVAQAQTAVNASTTDIDLDSAMIDDLSNDRTQLQLRAGLGLGRLSNVGTTENATGLNVAALIDLPVATGTSFLTGVNYVQKGASNGAADARINYLVIPVQLKANFGYPRAFRWSLGLGPYVGIKTSAYNTANKDNLTGIAGYDIGGRVSAALDFPIQSRYSVIAGADYDVGLTNITATTQTRALLLSLGLGVEI